MDAAYAHADFPTLRHIADTEDPMWDAHNELAWSKICELLGRHRLWLKRMRDALAQVWSGKAADRYLQEIDRRLDALADLHAIATENLPSAQQMGQSTVGTRYAIADLVGAWNAAQIRSTGTMTNAGRLAQIAEQARVVLQSHQDNLAAAAARMVRAMLWVRRQRVP